MSKRGAYQSGEPNSPQIFTMAQQFNINTGIMCGTEKESEIRQKKSKDMVEIFMDGSSSREYLLNNSVEDIASRMRYGASTSIPYGIHVHTQMAHAGVTTYADIARRAKNIAAIESLGRKYVSIVPVAETSPEKRASWARAKEARLARQIAQEERLSAPLTLPGPTERATSDVRRAHRDTILLAKDKRRSSRAPRPVAVRRIMRDYGESYESYPQWGIPIRVKVGADKDTISLVDRLVTSVTGAVMALTGGDGAAGRMIRKILMAVIPAIVLMLAVKLFGKTVGAVISLLGSAAFAFLGPFRHYFERATTQMGENGETALVSKIVAVGALAYFMKKKIPLVAMAGIISRLPSFQTATRNVMDWSMEFVQWLVNAIRGMLGKEHISFWKRRSDQVSEWMKEVTDLSKVPDGAQKYPEKVNELRNLGIDLARSFPDSVEIKNVCRVTEEMFVVARPVLKLMRLRRAEPICVVLHGKPGIGKSLLVKRLAAAYLMKHHPDLMRKTDRDPAPYMFTHDGGEYWSGYNEYQHKVMVLDDLASKRSSDAQSSDLASLMSIINTVEYPLNMAGVLDKGNVYFRSDYVIATTNRNAAEIEDLAAKVLTNPEAIRRRMHIFVTVTLKPEFSLNERFDIEKATSPEASDPKGVWSFNILGEDGKTPTRVFDSLIDFVKHINNVASARHVLAGREVISTHEFLDALTDDSDEAPEVEPQGLLHPIIALAGRTHVHAKAHEVEIKNNNDGTFNVAYVGDVVVRSEYAEVLESANKGWRTRTKEIFCWYRDWIREQGIIVRAINGFFVGVAIRVICDMIVNFVKMFLPTGRSKVAAHGDLSDNDETTLHTSFMSALSANSYVITVHKPGQAPSGGINVLFVKGRLAIMPAHYIGVFREVMVDSPGSMVSFENALGESFSMKIEDFGKSLDYVTKRDNGSPEDMVMLRLSSRREHRDITSRFRSSANWLSDNTDAGWYRVKSKADIEYSSVRVKNMTNLEYGERTVVNSDQLKYLIAVGYTYGVSCKRGDCGALLVHGTHTMPDCIIGMHTAGTQSGIGHSVKITREWLRNASDHFVEVRDITLPAESVRPVGDENVVTSQAMRAHVVGVSCVNVYSPLSAGNPMSESLVNEWSDDLGIDIEQLHPSNTTFSATLEALASHATPPTVHTSHPAFRAAAKDYFDRIGFNARGKFELLSVAEAAEGTVRGERFGPAINKKSSAGFPYQSRGFLTNQLFDAHGAVNLRSSTYRRYREDSDIMIQRAMIGKTTRNVFAVCPKPETRPLHKNLPRIIQAANKPYTISWRRLFWPLTKFYSEWKPTNECAIGMNPFTDWDTLSMWLLGNGGNVIAGDYSGFDKTHEPVITWALWEALSECFDDDEYNRVRGVLWNDVNGAEVQLGRLIYKLPRGLPSGHPGTAVINSAYNSVLLTLAYTSILSGGTDEEPFGPGWEKILPTFRDNVRLQVLGDDNIMTSTCDAFNELSIGPAMRRFGAVYTMDQKLNTAVAKFRRLHEVTFIGRGFRPTEEGFDPCLRLSSILDMGKWLQKRGDDNELWQVSVIENILAELSLHDQETWNLIAPVAVSKWSLVGYRVPVLPVEPNPESKSLWRQRVLPLLGGFYE